MGPKAPATTHQTPVPPGRPGVDEVWLSFDTGPRFVAVVDPRNRWWWCASRVL